MRIFIFIFFCLGAGSGIGKAACRLLNRDGATIIAADRNVDAAKEVANSLNGDNQFIELEVSSKQSIQNGIQNILSKFNAPPSIVVNAAGITKDNFLLKLDEDHFDDVIRVNLKVREIKFLQSKNYRSSIRRIIVENKNLQKKKTRNYRFM